MVASAARNTAGLIAPLTFVVNILPIRGVGCVARPDPYAEVWVARLV